MLKAPKIDRWLDCLDDRNFTPDKKTKEILERIWKLCNQIESMGDDGYRGFWLKAERGTIEDYGDYEEMLEDEIVSSYEEYVEDWKGWYPEEEKWYFFEIARYKQYLSIALNNKCIIGGWHWDKPGPIFDYSEFAEWMKEMIEDVIKQLKEGTYNKNVNDNLYFRDRTGYIARKDYFSLLPHEKEYLFGNITNDEINAFLTNIQQQKEDQPVGTYLKEMSANDFWHFAGICYKANQMEGYDTKSNQDLWKRYSFAYSSELLDIDPNDPKTFEEWLHLSYHDSHPFRLSDGGSRNSITMFPEYKEDKGYYLWIEGSSWSRMIETLKFYNALRNEGVAVYIYESERMKERLLQEGYIGIIHQHCLSIHCEHKFPGMNVYDFVNLSYEPGEFEMLLPKITWLKEREVKLVI